MARRDPLTQAPGALKSHNAKKLKRGTLWGFSTSILSQNIKQLEGGKIFILGKNLTVPKKLKGGPFSLARYSMLRRKTPFWFSSLGQMVQFGAIKFCRTFKNYFGQFVWIEKKESL